MPRLSVWALRGASISLLAGFTLGAFLLANKGQPFWPLIWSFLPAHSELLLVGWLAQLALGVAFWILPRHPGGSRGNETLAAASILLLDVGVVLVCLQGLVPVLVLIGRFCEATAGALFALHAWSRVRPLYLS